MWRPFISKFSDKTYEHFIKRHSSISSSNPKPTHHNSSDHYFPYTRSLSEDHTLRYEEYKTLQLKVKNQRKIIKKTEKFHLNRVKTACFEFKEQQQQEKVQKQEEILKARKCINNKTRKFQNLNLNPKPISEFMEKTYFSFTPKIREKVKIRRKSNKIKLKSSQNYKDFQEKTMNELKLKAPNYYADLHKEFMKIREHCEMTYDQYMKSKRLKRTDPFDVIKKRKTL